MTLPVELHDDESVQERIDRIESELLWRRADVVRAGRWSLFQHLTDVLEVLDAWQQPARVKLAGYLSCAYGDASEEGTPSLFVPEERDIVVELVGTDAERLLALLASTTPRRLLESAAAAVDRADQPATIFAGNGTATVVSRRELGDLLVIQLARISQSCAHDGGPAEWLVTASQLAAYARSFAEIIPPVFDDGRRHVGNVDERNLIDAYAALLGRPVTAHDGEARRLTNAAEASPWVGEPFIWLGLFALASGDVAAASACGKRAATALMTWNTAWDKRLSGLQWMRVADYLASAAPLTGVERDFLAERTSALLESAPRPDGFYAQLEAQSALGRPEISAPVVDEELPDDLDDKDHDWASFGILPARFAQYVSAVRDGGDGSFGMYPGLTALPWWDSNESDLLAGMEKMAADVAAECAALDRRLFRPLGVPADRPGDCDVFMLLDRGREVVANAALCPLTMAWLEQQAAAKSSAGSAYFARFSPGSKTGVQRSWTNTRLSYQLGLTQRADFVITVDGIPERLRYKRGLIFDGSFRHEFWNRGDCEFTMFSIDAWHPDLRADEIALIEGLNRAVTSNAKALHRAWHAGEALEAVR